MIKLTIIKEDYIRQQLEWVKYRAKVLGEMDARLRKMRDLAVFARDNELTPVEAQGINAKLLGLQQEVIKLDEQSRVFWVNCQ